MSDCWAVAAEPSTSWDGDQATSFHGMSLIQIMPIIEVEFRVTPPGQEEITDWKIKDQFSILVAFKEGEPNGTPKLHYHGYLQTTLTIKSIQRWLNDVAESDKYGVKGNAVFFTRKAHDHTRGYISKSRNCVLRHGTTQTTLDEWYQSSAEYNKEKVTDRKRKNRTREDELKPIWDSIKEELKTAISPTPDWIIERVLYKCYEGNIKFPSRMAMENFIIHALYPYRPEFTKSYFNRTFQYMS